MTAYLVFFLTTGFILAIAVLGLNLQWGFTGLFNGGVAAFFGAGAYGFALLAAPPVAEHVGGFGLAWPVAVAGGVAAAAALACVVGLATTRLRHDYLAIATFGVAVAFESVMRNAEGFAGGARGIRGIERVLETQVDNAYLYGLFQLALVSVVLALVYVMLQRLVRSPFGRLLRAIREDEVAARSLGKAPARARLVAFVLGAGVMGLSGALYAGFYAFVSPQDIMPILTFQIWAMLIVGGSGNNRGAILGTLLVWAGWVGSGWALAEFAPVTMQLYTGTLQYILIGLVIVGTLLARPRGLLPERLRR